MATLPKRKLIPLWQALIVAKGVRADESLEGSRHAILDDKVIRLSPAMYKLIYSEVQEKGKTSLDNLLKEIKVLVNERYAKWFR